MTSLFSPVVIRRGLLLAWGLLAFVVALSPGAEGSIRTSEAFFCLVCGSRGAGDAVLNVVFFLPLGFLLAPRHSLAWVVALGFALSGAIELAQELIPGRYPTLGDLIWNGTGTSLGAILSLLLRRGLDPGRPGPTAVVAWTAVVLPVAYLAGAGSLLEPVPTDAQYFGQWTADLDFMPVYEGEALEIETQYGPVPYGPLLDSQDLRLNGPWFLRARIVKGPPPPGPAPIASIYDSEKREIALLGAHHQDLVWRERSRAAALRFDAPDRRLLGGLSGHAQGDTVWIEARGDASRRCLSVGALEDCEGGVTPGRSWGFLLFLEGPAEERRRVIDVAWMATLAGLIGLLGGRPSRTLLLTLVAAAGVLVVVASTRLIPATGAEWAGFVAGVGGGGALRPLVRFLVQREGRHPVHFPESGQVGVDPTETELP